MDEEDRPTPPEWPEAGREPLDPPAAPRRSPFAIGLVLALVASLVANGLLGVRLRDEQDRLRALENRLSAAEQRVGELEQGSGAPSPPAPADPIRRLAAEVSRIRGLAFKSEVAPELLAPAAFQQRIAELFVRDNSREELDATGRILATLGVVPVRTDLYATLRELQEEQVAGFYDTDTKKLVVRANSARSPSPLDRILLAHELTHALTDQHFDLKRLDALQDAGKDDEHLAFLSLIEGDAQFTMRRYQQQILTAAEQRTLAQEFAELPTDALEKTPQFIQDALAFPYTTGVDFVETLFTRGGFDFVNDAYAKPPSSTEQILHPAKYLDSPDAPTAVSMPDVAAALGASWSEADAGQLGEFDLRLVADLGGGQGLSGTDARAAASGWDGGAYTGVTNGNQTVVAMLTVWDSEAEAREAVQLLGRWLPLRYRNVGSQFTPSGGTGSGWESRDGAGVVLRAEDRVVVLLGPARADVERARAAFRGF